MRIPAHLQDTAQALGLQTWVGRKAFPRDQFFRAIEESLAMLAQFQPNPSFEQLALMLAAIVDNEGSFLTHVLDKQHEIKDEAYWLRLCLACAWTIIQRYERELGNGKWPPQ